MKSDRPQKIKKRTKIQGIAISFLASFFVLGGIRFMLGWFHNPSHIPSDQMHLLNYSIIGFLAAYVGLVAWYKKTKGRWI